MVRSETLTLTVTKPLPVAPKYERVHFVAHCRFGFVDKEKLRAEVETKVAEIEAEVGYKCYFRRVEASGLEPIWLDIDFVFDLPAVESPVATIVILAVIGILGTLGILVLLFIWWTIWHEESEIFVCEQCADNPTFAGRADYDAHLKLAHPEKWEYIEQQRGEAYWWTKIIEWMPMILGFVLIVAVTRFLPKPRREE